MFLESCKNLEFPQESIEVLQEGLGHILELAEEELLEACECLIDPQRGSSLALMQTISEKTGIRRCTSDMVTLLYAIPRLKDVYAQKGLPEQLMWDSMADLRYKLYECKAVYGAWGTVATSWHRRFYWLQLFKLGRLEFEQIPCPWDAPFGAIQKGDPVVNIHIPSCGPLLPEQVEDSLEQASRFYRDAFPGGVIPFVCHSWLLYTPIVEQVFPEGSNLKAFARRFTVVEDQPDPLNKNFWRVFDLEYSEDALENAPADTTLRRNMLQFMRAGNCMGNGKGMILRPWQK